MAVVAVVLAAATVVEKYQGTDFVHSHIYGSWWFFALLALVAVGGVVSIVQGRMWRRPPLLLIHAAVVLILAGGALTTLTAQHGSMTLLPGRPTSAFASEDGEQYALPFALTLNGFDVVPYPGTHSPMDFVSHISVDGVQTEISMNNIYRRGGYRFYQEDYGDDGSSTLAVAHDPLGIPVTYAGYTLLLAGLLWLLLGPRGRFRRLLKGASVAVALFGFMFAASGNAQAAGLRTLPREQADQMGRMLVLYKGRICPVQTLAKDFTTKLCGNATYKGFSSEQVLAGWMFYHEDWRLEPMIKVKGDDVKQLLGAEGRYVRLADYTRSDGSNPVADALKSMPRMSPEAKNLRAADEKFNLVAMLYSGGLLKLFPITDSMGNLAWYAQNDALPSNVDDGEYLFVRQWTGFCQELVVKGEYGQLGHVFGKTREYQRKNCEAAGADVLPSESRLRAERLYNALTTGRWLAMLAIAIGLVFFVYTLVLSSRERTMPRVWRGLGIAWVTMLTLFLLLILVLRWMVGGHIPMAGGFDSMNLMAIAIGIITLCTVRRHDLMLSVGMLTAGFCLLVAMMSGANPPVTHLMPVLNSPLLTLHVTVIMFAYALFFFVMIGGVGGLIAGGRTADNLHRIGLAMLYPAVALMALGIVVGALWANVSWGNYWSWDPKEVWALITLIVYAFPLHQSLRAFSRPRFFHLYCVVAFLSVIVTYFGVNLLLGGMHSYGG